VKYKKRNSVSVLGAEVLSMKPVEFLAKANAYVGGRISVFLPSDEPD